MGYQSSNIEISVTSPIYTTTCSKTQQYVYPPDPVPEPEQIKKVDIPLRRAHFKTKMEEGFMLSHLNRLANLQDLEYKSNRRKYIQQCKKQTTEAIRKQELESKMERNKSKPIIKVPEKYRPPKVVHQNFSKWTREEQLEWKEIKETLKKPFYLKPEIPVDPVIYNLNQAIGSHTSQNRQEYFEMKVKEFEQQQQDVKRMNMQFKVKQELK